MPEVKTYVNNFNLLRLFAAAQVLLVHVANHHGFTGLGPELLKATPGVPIFFFVSGYLISQSYLRSRTSGVVEFGRNRGLRIFPALIVCVALSTIMVVATGYFGGRPVAALDFIIWVVGQMTVVQFYNPGFMREFGTGVLNGALWTITVELQFYVLTPFLVWLMDRSRAATAALFVASIAANLFIAWVGEARGIAVKALTISFLPWVFMFMTGMVVAQVPRAAGVIHRVPFVLALILYVGAMTLLGSYKGNAQNSINPVAFVLLAIMVFKAAHVAIPIGRRVQAFIAANDFSYGIYLYHMPVINLTLFIGLLPLAGLGVTIVVVAALAIGSWYLVERPALKRKRSVDRPLTQPA